MSQLILVEEGPPAGSRHTVVAGATIGREGCEVALGDPGVSRRHARILSLGAGLAIEDLDSTNGTYLNGRRLTEASQLGDGDAIQLGSSTLRVEVEPVGGGTRLTPMPPDPVPGGEPPPAPIPAVESRDEIEPQPGLAETGEPGEPDAPAAVEPDAPVEGEARGDVPPPPPASASRVHRALAGAPAPVQGPFQVEEAPRNRRGSAATRVEATVVSYAVVIATAAAVVAYLAQR